LQLRQKELTVISIHFFDDPYLTKKFSRKARAAVCDILGETTKCYDDDVVSEFLRPVLNLYRPYHPMEAAAIYPGGSPEDDGVMLWEAIQNDFGVFNWQYEDNLSSLFEHLLGQLNEYCLNPVCRFDHELGDEGNEFEYDYWENFKKELKHSNRFFPTYSIDQRQLKTMFQYRKKVISSGTNFFRVRPQGNFPTTGLGKPPSHLITKPGRANPIGISYLYLGNSHEVCRIESRAGASNYTLGTFEVRSNLKIVDLSSPHIVSPFELKNKLRDYISSFSIIKMYVDDMSRRADPNAPYLDYIPTQYLSEFIKKLGYDGLMFKSSQTGNVRDKNLLLFEEDKVDCIAVVHYP
jgi:hypothetical protein